MRPQVVTFAGIGPLRRFVEQCVDGAPALETLRGRAGKVHLCDFMEPTTFSMQFFEELARLGARYVSDGSEKLLIQRWPNLRWLPPGVEGPGWHADSDYQQPDGEYTLWIPLTRAYATNSLNLATTDEWEGGPLDLVPGEALIFDSRNHQHGTTHNVSAQSRVSIDVRILPWRSFDPSWPKRCGEGLRYVPGEYYVVTDPSTRHP